MNISLSKNFKKSLNEINLETYKHYLLHVSLIDLGLFDDISPDATCNFLLTILKEKTSNKSINSEYYINDRQQQVLNKLSKNILDLTIKLNHNIPLDIVSEYIKEIMNIVDEIVNPIKRDEVIDSIFSSFCVGK